MGVGHVPQEPIRAEGTRAELQGRERRRVADRRTSRHRQALAAQRLARARWAEELVARWYRQHGFDILAMNWRMYGGELDIVARRGNLLVVCEVKARANNAFGSPAEALTPRKQQLVRRAGRAFVDEQGLTRCRVRYDLACVTGTQLEVHVDAF
ncbi:MAG: YraN family protein [Actinobacteria bacterium]|nr:YraN family protein [Actinomycetota bacterium]